MTTADDRPRERSEAAAFRRLLRTGRPVTVAALAEELRAPEGAVRDAIEELRDQGQLRLDRDGRVIAVAGLSIRPDRHRIDLEGRRFWTWCAYDFFGIFAALGANGHAESVIPDTGRTVRIEFRDGRPVPAALLVFLPANDPSGVADAYGQWCPHSNLFRSREAAVTWAAEHGRTGQVLTMSEAADRGGRAWRALIDR